MHLEPWQRPVTYAAIGATQAKDLMEFPPAGYRPIERRVRIGHGEARFTWAWTTTMSWGIQRLSGFVVDVLDSPREVVELSYRPVSFDASGEPVEPAAVGAPAETMFGPDGVAFAAPGDTALLRIPFGPFRVTAPARVVYVLDEPDRKGFAYGTLPGHPENGEEAFIVERDADDSVWLRITAFSRPANWFFWLGYPVLRLSQEFYTSRYERALTGPIS